MTMKTNSDLSRQNTVDLSTEIITTNPILTPLISLLYSKGKNTTAKDVIVRRRIKTLSTTVSGGKKEGALAPDTEKSSYAWVDNNLEIFSKATEISGTVSAIEGGNTSLALAKEIADRLTELKGDMENAIINGTKKNEDGTSGRKMGGLMSLVDTSCTVDASAKALTEDHILDALQAMFTKGGSNGELYLFCNATTKRKLNKIYKEQTNVTIPLVTGNGDVGIVVQRVFTDFGIVNIVIDNYMADKNILIANVDVIEVPELRKPTYQPLAKIGDSDKGQVVAEVSVITAPQALAKITNFA